MLSNEQQEQLSNAMAKDPNTHVITLDSTPSGINCQITSKTLLNNGTNWEKFSIGSSNDECIITILPSNAIQYSRPLAVINPSIIAAPSRTQVKGHFPIDMGFAITVDKAQGQTMERVIVAMSERDLKITNMKYSCLYVATSRVRQKQHLRILLKKKDNEVEEWNTLGYVSTLKRDPSIAQFFAGYSKDRTNWTKDKWKWKWKLPAP